MKYLISRRGIPIIGKRQLNPESPFYEIRYLNMYQKNSIPWINRKIRIRNNAMKMWWNTNRRFYTTYFYTTYHKN